MIKTKGTSGRSRTEPSYAKRLKQKPSQNTPAQSLKIARHIYCEMRLIKHTRNSLKSLSHSCNRHMVHYKSSKQSATFDHTRTENFNLEPHVLETSIWSHLQGTSTWIRWWPPTRPREYAETGTGRKRQRAPAVYGNQVEASTAPILDNSSVKINNKTEGKPRVGCTHLPRAVWNAQAAPDVHEFKGDAQRIVHGRHRIQQHAHLQT